MLNTFLNPVIDLSHFWSLNIFRIRQLPYFIACLQFWPVPRPNSNIHSIASTNSTLISFNVNELSWLSKWLRPFWAPASLRKPTLHHNKMVTAPPSDREWKQLQAIIIHVYSSAQKYTGKIHVCEFKKLCLCIIYVV